MSTVNNLTLTNQFGETSINEVVSGSAAFADKVPAKTGVQALAAIADPPTATAEDVAEAYNALLAALKVVS